MRTKVSTTKLRLVLRKIGHQLKSKKIQTSLTVTLHAIIAVAWDLIPTRKPRVRKRKRYNSRSQLISYKKNKKNGSQLIKANNSFADKRLVLYSTSNVDTL
jgi:hypothetical protein